MRTSTGALVPADVVLTQDAVADVLVELQKAHDASVRKHDATPVCEMSLAVGCEPEAVHAARRMKLQRNAAALRSGYNGIIAWKRAATSQPAAGLFCELVTAVPDLLTIAAGFGAVSTSTAETIRKTVAVLGAGCPRASGEGLDWPRDGSPVRAARAALSRAAVLQEVLCG